MIATPIRADLMFVSINATAAGYRGTWASTGNAASTSGLEVKEAASIDRLRDLAAEQGCPWNEDAAVEAQATFVPSSKRDVTSICARCGAVVSWSDRHRDWHREQPHTRTPQEPEEVAPADPTTSQPTSPRRFRAGRTRQL